MVANRAMPKVIMVSICGPISDIPRSIVASVGGLPRRAGHGVERIPAASRTKAAAQMAVAPCLLCIIVIGVRPAGFIMYMIMKTAMMAISIVIISTMTIPR
ncbi:hypothetical protein Smic_09100 [Streptomyces microflavus]|uniref:Uncharacterized protein n=1 Tax=Streptomyces microflavus TaxID=1919 RepID=A0A7J0CK95_STRMI|nr:hypothetical protein Smic_09100 [Streptomyces microflavus]